MASEVAKSAGRQVSFRLGADAFASLEMRATKENSSVGAVAREILLAGLGLAAPSQNINGISERIDNVLANQRTFMLVALTDGVSGGLAVEDAEEFVRLAIK